MRPLSSAEEAAAGSRFEEMRLRVMAKEEAKLRERGALPVEHLRGVGFRAVCQPTGALGTGVPSQSDEADRASVARARAEGLLGHDWRNRVHASHRLAMTGDTVFCTWCGRYSGSAQRLVGLARRCAEKPGAGSSYATKLQRLRGGHHPTTGARLGGVAQLSR